MIAGRALRLLPPLALLAIVIGCSPLVRLRARFEPPAGMKLDPARFTVAVATACESGSTTKSSPPAAPVPSPTGERGSLIGDGIELELSERGHACLFQLTGWLDANGNGTVDAGDAMASFPHAIEARDRGLCSGNLTEAPPVQLRRLP